jgi:hypothetical protein
MGGQDIGFSIWNDRYQHGHRAFLDSLSVWPPRCYPEWRKVIWECRSCCICTLLLPELARCRVESPVLYSGYAFPGNLRLISVVEIPKGPVAAGKESRESSQKRSTPQSRI